MQGFKGKTPSRELERDIYDYPSKGRGFWCNGTVYPDSSVCDIGIVLRYQDHSHNKGYLSGEEGEEREG